MMSKLKGDINDYLPSILNPRTVKKEDCDTLLSQISTTSRFSLSIKRNKSINVLQHCIKKEQIKTKDNVLSISDTVLEQKVENIEDSLGSSAIEDLNSYKKNSNTLSSNTLYDFNYSKNNKDIDNDTNKSNSSNNELDDTKTVRSCDTTFYSLNEIPQISISFGVIDCDNIELTSSSGHLKKVLFTHKDNNLNVNCSIAEGSSLSSVDSILEENMNEQNLSSGVKRSAVSVAVNIKIKKRKTSHNVKNDTGENTNVLFLNTNAIEKLSHVIVQPPNYKLVKRHFSYNRKLKRRSDRKLSFGTLKNNGYIVSNSCGNLKQNRLDRYFKKNCVPCRDSVLHKAEQSTLSIDNYVINDSLKCVNVIIDKCNAAECDKDMSKNSGVSDAVKYDRPRTCPRKSVDLSPKSTRVNANKRENVASPKRHDIKSSNSDAQRVISQKTRQEITLSAPNQRKRVDSLQFPLANIAKDIFGTSKSIPFYKIVAGTHFAVDAFSYGDIENVKYYFLTHFHSDHYMGLKKTFNKTLFCSKITADLCKSRLGVNSKCIQVITIYETIRIEGVEVTAVDANHCPGAIMLVFTLLNGKTILHTGDFRASPAMESFPIFWNKDIDTVYLDTTYCNPRYDFPTQDQSIEMALHFLQQKKISIEKAGRKFSTVLIVCGTYTIGKEKFFLGIARRVGCTVWACPEKDRVLQVVEGRSFSHAPPESCQLHVVPMRDITHEKLRTYLDSLQGAFSEVVAFKPSGWENGKNSTVEKEKVTIHGIPYSEHSSFSELVRFVKYLKPKLVVPTVEIAGGIKSVQKYFPCPLINKEQTSQMKLTDYFRIQNRPQVPDVT